MTIFDSFSEPTIKCLMSINFQHLFQVTKCCSSSDILDLSNLNSPKCATGGGSEELGIIIGLDLKKQIGSSKINITLQTDMNHKMPTCTLGFEVKSLLESGKTK